MHPNWHILQEESALELIAQRSHQVPCLIFKHSTRCEISAIAKYRLEDAWGFSAEELEPWYLDLIQFRPVSNAIVERFSVHHESPQVLILKDGVCIYDADHLDIDTEEIKEALLEHSV